MNVYSSSNRFGMSLSSTGSTWDIANATGTTTTISPNQWYHVAVTFNGSNTYTLWVNGSSELSITNTNVIPSVFLADNIVIGATNTGSGITNSINSGFIDEFRISKTARYSTSFTPSSTAFTTDTNTVFLQHFNGEHNSSEWSQGQEVPAITWTTKPTILSSNSDIQADSIDTNSLSVARTRESITNLGSLSSSNFAISWVRGSSYILSPPSSNTLSCFISDLPLLKQNQIFTLVFLIDSSSFKSYISTVNVNGSTVSVLFNSNANSVVVGAAPLVIQTLSLLFLQASSVPRCISTLVPYDSHTLASISALNGTFQLVTSPLPYYLFTSGSVTIRTVDAINVNYMLVGGGGGGGANGGGGGGAGGLLVGSMTLQANTIYTLTVGASGQPAPINYSTSGLRGGDTILAENGVVLLTAIGGGGGASRGGSAAPTSGGSGGGGGGIGGAGGTAASGTSGQGFAGGNGFEAGASSAGGGGGGAAGVGANAANQAGGSGGIGYRHPLTQLFYAGGGGGGLVLDGTNIGASGSGVGGAGGRTGLSATSGTTNRGGGGGGGGPGATGGSGGSGVILMTGLTLPGLLTGSYSVTESSGFRFLSFTESGTLRLLETVVVNYLIVGGGGGGGMTNGGGGGAGGVLVGLTKLDAGVTYTITVGEGGAGAPLNESRQGNQGGNSSIVGTGVSIVASGGGGGGNRTSNGTPSTGGSGGGGGGSVTATIGFRVGASGTFPQGSAGGNGTLDTVTTSAGGGGGGGFGSVGGNGFSNGGGAGGTGFRYSFNSTFYAAGGAGGVGSGGSTTATGGSGIGGNGGRNNINAFSGTANTGSGGGGAGTGTSTSGNGGSGIVILLFRTPIPV
jgi:hypothetical protein